MGKTPFGPRRNAWPGFAGGRRAGAIRPEIIHRRHCQSARTGRENALVVVSVLIANASTDQAGSAERIELNNFLEIRAFIDECTDFGCSPRRHRLEVIRISHIGSQTLGNELRIYLSIGIA